MYLLLTLAPLAQTLPAQPAGIPDLESAQSTLEPASAPVVAPGGSAGSIARSGDAEEVQQEQVLLEKPLEEGAPPDPWSAPQNDAARQGLLGPWPDGFQPDAGRLDMLPTVDPVTGRILDVGSPMEGELQGPIVPSVPPVLDALPEPVLLPSPMDTEPAVLESLSQAETPVPTPPVADPPVPLLEAAPSAEIWPFEPPKGGQSFARSVLWFFIATSAVFLARRMDKARGTLPKRGLLPVLARVMEVVSRITALIAVLFGTMRLVPDAYFQYFPVVLVAASVAVGWSARDVLHDVLAGILLVVEHHLVPDMRVEADGRVGTVISVGFRSVSMESDDGQIIRIPNRDFLSTDTRMDKSPYAPVEVVVEAPHGARRRLEEIALASPLVAPGQPPEVFRDPEHPERWVVRARLVHPRWTLAFRGAVQDRLEKG